VRSAGFFVIILVALLLGAAGWLLELKSARRKRTKRDLPKHILSPLLRRHDGAVAFTDCAGTIEARSDVFDQAFASGDGLQDIPPTVLSLVPPKAAFTYSRILQYVSRTTRAVSEYELDVLSGRIVRKIRLTVVPIMDTHHTVLGLLHFFDQPQHEKQLASDFGHVEKLTNIGQIAAGMAHELNTPLGSIILSSDLILESAISGIAREEAHKIKQQAAHCSEVVQRLLGYARKDDEAKSECDVAAVIGKVKSLVEVEAKKRKALLTLTTISSKAVVLGNENKLEQVFFNLFSNSLYAVEENGSIEVHVALDSLLNQVVVTFRDNGCGIAPENLPRIFDPFFTTKPGSEGTGLGLALSRKIIIEHGGRVEVDSTVGGGTTFTIYLPMAQ
jgi:signal transduction histidine kinase